MQGLQGARKVGGIHLKSSAMQFSALTSSRPLALGRILATALLISVGTWPVQAGPGKASGRSIAPVSQASGQKGTNAVPSRIRSSAPVDQAGSENSEAGLNSGSRKSRSSGASN